MSPDPNGATKTSPAVIGAGTPRRGSDSEEMMHQSHEPDKPLARIEDSFLVLNDGDMWDYEIHMDCLRTAAQVSGWIDHLSSKRWFSAAMKTQMLGALAQEVAP